MVKPPPPRSAVYGAIFDLDGVLVDSERVHLQAWLELAEQIGKPGDLALFKRTFGQTSREIIRQWLGESISDEDIRRLTEAKETNYRRLATTQLEPLPGAVDLVRQLIREDYRLAIGSSAPRENIDLSLQVLGLADAFSAIVTGQDVRRGKPDPEVFALATHRLRLGSERCAVFEDAPQGVEAAHASGALAIGVASSRPPELLRRADRVLTSLSDLSPAELKRMIDERAAAARPYSGVQNI